MQFPFPRETDHVPKGRVTDPSIVKIEKLRFLSLLVREIKRGSDQIECEEDG